ncbi:MAG: hypothetical protein U0164_08305 [Gemmatimonadaceae bacterium]
MTTRLFLNASQVVTCAGPARARRGEELRDAGVLSRAAVAVEGDRIVAVGSEDQLQREYPDAALVDCGRGVLLPGLVDSHTHAIFGKPRFEEQEMRAAGYDYMDIARRGGGFTRPYATSGDAARTSWSPSRSLGFGGSPPTARPRSR